MQSFSALVFAVALILNCRHFKGYALILLPTLWFRFAPFQAICRCLPLPLKKFVRRHFSVIPSTLRHRTIAINGSLSGPQYTIFQLLFSSVAIVLGSSSQPMISSRSLQSEG
jgi:hypothetical protein